MTEDLNTPDEPGQEPTAQPAQPGEPTEPIEPQEPDGEPKDPEGEPSEPEPKTFSQEDVDRIIQKRLARERRERERAEARLDAALANRPDQHPKQPDAPKEFQPTRPRPSIEQFDYDQDKYIDAVTDWKIEQREAQRTQEQRQQTTQQQQHQAAVEFETRRVAAIDAGKKDYADFEDVVFSLPGNVMTPEVAALMLETQTPHKVAYYLGSNPDEAAKIAQLPTFQKAVALGRIESQIAAMEKTKQTTNAPPPPKPVGGNEPARLKPQDLAKKDPKKWIELRNAGKI